MSEKRKVRSLCQNRFCMMPSHLVLESDDEFLQRCPDYNEECEHFPRCVLKFPESHDQQRSKLKRHESSKIDEKEKLKTIKFARQTINAVLDSFSEDIRDETNEGGSTYEEIIEENAPDDLNMDDEGLGREENEDSDEIYVG